MNVERLVKNGIRQVSRQGRHERKQYGKVARFMVDNAMLDGMKVNSYSEQLSLTEAIKEMGRVNQEVVNQQISDMIRHEKLEKHGIHQNGAQLLRDQIERWKAAVNKAQYWARAIKGECRTMKKSPNSGNC